MRPSCSGACGAATSARSSDRVLIFDDLTFYDWSAPATPKGIGATTSLFDNHRFFQDMNPTSATYGPYSASRDSALVQRRGSMPAGCYFLRGQFVRNTSVTLAAGKVLTGWLRLISGNAHVVDVDWWPST